MSDDRFRDNSLGDLEAIVRGAAGYVQPTDDLRPRTLEAARDRTSEQRAQRRIGGLALAVVLLATCGVPDFVRDRLGQTGRFTALATSQDLHARATQRASTIHSGADWALFEVYSELRNDQARRFGESY